MDQRAKIDRSPAEPISAKECTALSVARTYIATLQDRIRLFNRQQLVDALTRLDRAYREFPELELEHPRRELFQRLQSVAPSLPDQLANPLLQFIGISTRDAACDFANTLSEPLGDQDSAQI